MEDLLVSVIMPAYNMGKYIVESLESVKNQSYSSWECVVVNDGSTDDTRQKIEMFILGDSRFKLINIDNSGVSAARNIAVKHSKGVYIFPLDGDDCIHEDCIGRCVDKFKTEPDIKLVYTDTRLFGTQSGIWNLPSFSYVNMLKYNMVHNSSLFLRKDFDRVGGYRANMIYGLEDWDFLIALLYGCSERQVVKIEEPLFYYRASHAGRGSTVATNGKQSEMLDCIVYNNFSIYREYFPDIFNRLLEYDHLKTMMNKPLVKSASDFLIRLSKIKSRILKNR